MKLAPQSLQFAKDRHGEAQEHTRHQASPYRMLAAGSLIRVSGPAVGVTLRSSTGADKVWSTNGLDEKVRGVNEIFRLAEAREGGAQLEL